MIRKKILSLVFVQLSGIVLCAFSADSLSYIMDLKQYAQKEWGGNTDQDLFTKWGKGNGDKPLTYLFVSLPDTVKSFIHLFEYYDTAEFTARKKGAGYKREGYDTFCYRTYGNAQAYLFKRLLSYEEEATAFVVFHELAHNFRFRQGINMPYEFEEAMCDVVGNYGTLEFARKTGCCNIMAASRQIATNETIYLGFNKAIMKINTRDSNIALWHAECRQMLDTVLPACNLFQRDRFDYPVNNAYLVKNRYYCEYYFLLRNVFLRLGTVKAFLAFMKTLPQDQRAAVEYLKKAV